MNPMSNKDCSNICSRKNSMMPAILAKNLHVSLREWRTFNAVVSCGGYANAAKFLHVSQPAVSYTIAKMEEQLGLRLLRLYGRKAQLTEYGREIFERSRLLLCSATELEDFVDEIKKSHQPQIRIAVDTTFPTSVTARALREWSMFAPDTKVQLIEAAGSEIETLLQDEAADLAISGQLASGFRGEKLVEIEYIAVAHPNHPLCRLEREVTQADMDRETQVIPDANFALNFNNRINSTNKEPTWIVSTMDSAETVLKEGLCFGWLPKHRVQSALDAGELQALPMQMTCTRTCKFYLVYGHQRVSANDETRLAEIFRGAASKIYMKESGGQTGIEH